MATLFVLIGPQGAGKGTQSQMVYEAFNLLIVATGDMLRTIARAETPLGRQVREAQAKGNLVPDHILAEIVGHRLQQSDCENGCILDGFPRTLPQAELLESIAAEHGDRIVAINLDVPRDVLQMRLSGRQTCVKCGAVYHRDLKPSKEPGVCDLDGGLLVTRSDDNEESIARRLELYDEKTWPLLDYYDSSNRLYNVSGVGTVDEVFERIRAIVKANIAPELSVSGER
jgi:adenylate kinase